MNGKQAIVLNYGMMLSDLGMDLKEKTDFISRFFRENPDLNHDGDLMDIAMEFQEFLIALKRLDKLVNQISERVLPK